MIFKRAALLAALAAAAAPLLVVADPDTWDNEGVTNGGGDAATAICCDTDNGMHCMNGHCTTVDKSMVTETDMAPPGWFFPMMELGCEDDPATPDVDESTWHPGWCGTMSDPEIAAAEPPAPQGPDPSSGGDPHFKTWSGEYFDFHGECDLVLIDAPKFNNGKGLHIQLRTKIRRGYSYIETAVVKFGPMVFSVSSWGLYSLEGVDSARLPRKMGDGYVVSLDHSNKREHIFRIHKGHGEGEIIEIKSFKDMVSVNLGNTKAEDYADSVGILGSFQGQRLGRNGTVVEDPIAFGQEWQVRPQMEESLFEATRHPQFPVQCIMPDAKEQERRRLRGGVSHEEAEAVCEHHTNPDEKAHCVFDVVATQDLEVADAGSF